MGTRGRVQLREVFRMIEECAPGSTIKEHDHNYSVCWKGRVFPSLHKGEHGKDDRAEVQIGVVKKMVRALNIDFEAAAKHIGRLRG